MDGGFLSNKATAFRETLKGRPRVHEWIYIYILYNLCVCVCVCVSNQYFHTCKIPFMADIVSKVMTVVP